MEILTNRIALGTVTSALISICGGTSYAAPMFGVVGSPIDLSANVSEAILPGGTIFEDSNPLFGTSPDPKQSAELLHLSSMGVNPWSHSSVSGAFASSLAESNGNGSVGVFGSPGGPTRTRSGNWSPSLYGRRPSSISAPLAATISCTSGSRSSCGVYHRIATTRVSPKHPRPLPGWTP